MSVTDRWTDSQLRDSQNIALIRLQITEKLVDVCLPIFVRIFSGCMTSPNVAIFTSQVAHWAEQIWPQRWAANTCPP